MKTVKVELYENERDFIIEVIEYALLDDLLKKLKIAKPNRNGILIIALNAFDLEQLIGNLSLEANHNTKRFVQDLACEMAEKLEIYESRLTRVPC